MEVEDLDRYQHIPYGTRGWTFSYGRRNNIELLNKLLRIDDGMDKEMLHAFGLEARQVVAVLLSVSHNLEVAKGYQFAKTPEERGDLLVPAPAPLPSVERAATAREADDPDEPPPEGPLAP